MVLGLMSVSSVGIVLVVSTVVSFAEASSIAARCSRPHFRGATLSPSDLALPTQLAVFASQCKCRFIGTCSCRESVMFMDCMADACTSGSCNCSDTQFLDACHDMAATCPDIGLQCSLDKARCVHHPLTAKANTDDILRDLEVMKMRKCKLEEAMAAGFLNADNRFQELEPMIEHNLEALKKKDVKEMPDMRCSKPLVSSSFKAPDADQTPGNTTTKAPVEVKGSAQELDADDAEDADEKEKTQTGSRTLPSNPETTEEPPSSTSLGSDDDKTASDPTDQRSGSLSQHTHANRNRYLTLLSSILAYILIVLLIAFIYHRKLRLKINWVGRAKPSDKPGFGFGLCGCIQDLKMSLFVCCCPLIRWADTVSKANQKDGRFMDFWPALLLMLSLEAALMFMQSVAHASFTAEMLGFTMIAIGIMYRQKLRVKWALNPHEMKTYVQDCLSWTFCTCCVIIQEAREVEYKTSEFK